MTDPILREVFVLYSAWGTLATYVATGDPRTVDPHDVYGAACACDQARLAALLYGNGHGDTLEAAADLLDELLAMARDGRRPRFGREVGLVPGAFQ